MLSVYFYSIASVVIVSFVSLAGIFAISLKEKVLKNCVFLTVSLAVGALLGDAFIHLIPEAFENINKPTLVSVMVIAGILVFFVIEKFLHWHHHSPSEERAGIIHSSGQMILISDGVHNFIDGLIIGASYLVSIEVGIATTIAVILHEIPQEIGDFGVLINSGYTRARALWLNFLSAVMAVVGVIVALLVADTGKFLTIWLIPLSAGGFIYIALSDLIPELHKTKSVRQSVLQLAVIAIGVMAMLVLLVLE